MNRKPLSRVALILAAAAWTPGEAAAPDPTLAAAFGARPDVIDIAISPEGKRAIFVSPDHGHGTFANVVDLTTGDVKQVEHAEGDPLAIVNCGWAAEDRAVCTLYGLSTVDGVRLAYTRLVAFDADGKNEILLGRRSRAGTLRISQVDGTVVDWLAGRDGTVLMERDFVPEASTGTLMAQSQDGFGVELVDTRSGHGKLVEAATTAALGYLSDGRGVIRIMRLREARDSGLLNGTTLYRYRSAGNRAWHAFSTIGADGAGLRPIAVDGSADVAYALQKHDGRNALYRVALDGTLKADLVLARPDVDVDDVETIGRGGRVIGASYYTDRRVIEYFDPAYRALAASLAKALPKLPLIQFESASADERWLLLYAESDTDPGHAYLLDRTTHRLTEVMPFRPQLSEMRLAEVKSITYPAADGTPIPAYLTLPPGSDGHGLPAIVMPHGGPSSRDNWGFDWLAQYYAQRGFAVLQPNYRGSSGYGDDWAHTNAFRNWRLAIGDVVDAGRWLVSSGTAAPSKLAIVGWSYGGYAALQANVIDPDLFKAVVAIAPVTDLGMLKEEARGFVNFNLVATEIGGGAIVADGSPARHADRFKAPVIMFHGTNDINVGIRESRTMDAALRAAHATSSLIVYPGLDHRLDDATARTDLLTRSDAFLRTSLGP